MDYIEQKIDNIIFITDKYRSKYIHLLHLINHFHAFPVNYSGMVKMSSAK